jgi:hypothetical protein
MGESGRDDAVTQQSKLVGRFKGSCPAHRIDGTQVITVPMLDRLAGCEVDTERGTIQRRFYIMRNDGIASKDHLYVAFPDKSSHVLASGGVDYRWTQHKQDLAVMGAGLAHLIGHLIDG